MRDTGASAENVVRTVSPLRNHLKANIRATGPWIVQAAAEARNLVKYGNKLGPTPEALFRQYGSWEKAMDAISRTNQTIDRFSGASH
jgi:filamentous hemagglutinin